MLTYRQAEKLLGAAKKKKLYRNTNLVKLSKKRYGIKLGSNTIIEINNDKTYVVRHGDKPSAIAMRRIREFSPARIFKRKSGWHLNKWQKFYNGAIIDSKGDVILPVPRKKYNKYECVMCCQSFLDCHHPLTQGQHNRIQRNADRQIEQWGYVFELTQRYLDRGVQNG